MEHFIIDLMYVPVTAIWKKKLLVPRNSISVAVDLNRFGVEGDTFGSPWVV